MPIVHKIIPPTEATKKRGRPVGSKNKKSIKGGDAVLFDNPMDNPMYRYTAKDGCTIEICTPRAQVSCKHGKTMFLVKE